MGVSPWTRPTDSAQSRRDDRNDVSCRPVGASNAIVTLNHGLTPNGYHMPSHWD